MATTGLLVLLVSFLAVQVQGKKIFCYYSSFSQTRHGIGNFLPENINPDLCTHLIYAFVDITPDGKHLIPFNRNDLGPRGLYSRTLALKEKNPLLKVLLAVGGWQIGSKPFIPMIRSESNRRAWIKNVVTYLRKHGFDGFDVDWEFPATRGSPPEDKYRFTKLMKGLYEAFAEEAAETGREKLLLTLATASGTYYIAQSYEPEQIIKYVDFMLLMTYNYHGQWEKITGHHSGLYRHRDDPKTGEKAQLYQEWSIDYWLDVGIPKDRLIVGIPTYGMSYTLASPSSHGVHAPAVGGGRMGDYTRETGILAYYEVCMNLRDKGWNSVWIDDQSVPYAYGGDQWVGYEDQKSIVLKANNIKSRGLAGAFVWSIEMDDFRGTCGAGHYPLLTTIQDILSESHSKSAAGQPGLHSPTELTLSNEKQAQLQWRPLEQTPNTDQQAQEPVVPLWPKKMRKANSRRFLKLKMKEPLHRHPKLAEEELSITTTWTSTPSTTAPAEATTGRLQELWWTQPLFRQTKMFRTKNWVRSGKRRMWRHNNPLKIEDEWKISKETSELPKLTNKIQLEVHNPPSKQNLRQWPSSSEGDNINFGNQNSHQKPTALSSTEQPRDTSTTRQETDRSLRPVQTTTLTTTRPEEVTSNSSSFRETTTQLEKVTTAHTRRWTKETTTTQKIPETTSRIQEYTKATQVEATTEAVVSTEDVATATTESGQSASHSEGVPAVIAGSEEARLCRSLGVGTFADPHSCEHFLICMPGNWLNYPPHVMSCPAGTRFDSDLKICNYALRVTCKQ